MWFSWKCCDIFVIKPKTMNRKTSQGETPVFVNLLSDMGFKAVYADPENKSLHRSLAGTAALFRYACRPIPLNLNINN